MSSAKDWLWGVVSREMRCEELLCWLWPDIKKRREISNLVCMLQRKLFFIGFNSSLRFGWEPTWSGVTPIEHFAVCRRRGYLDYLEWNPIKTFDRALDERDREFGVMAGWWESIFQEAHDLPQGMLNVPTSAAPASATNAPLNTSNTSTRGLCGVRQGPCRHSHGGRPLPLQDFVGRTTICEYLLQAGWGLLRIRIVGALSSTGLIAARLVYRWIPVNQNFICWAADQERPEMWVRMVRVGETNQTDDDEQMGTGCCLRASRQLLAHIGDS